MMVRTFFIVLFIGLILEPMGGFSEELLKKDEIIRILGGACSTVEAPLDEAMKTRAFDRSISGDVKSKMIGVVPKHVVFNLLFKINSTEFADHCSDQQLAQLGIALSSEDLNHIKVEIAGHTCDLGTDKYNLDLSQRRAERIKRDLIKYYQIRPERLLAVGYGEKFPTIQNSSEENRRMNRRVVVKRIQ